MKTYLSYSARIVFYSLVCISTHASEVGATNQNPSPPLFTPANLNKLELVSGMTKEQEIESENKVRAMEADASEQINLFENSLDSSLEAIKTSDNPSDVEISIYQKTPGIKWTFLVAKENGKIRYVFATSPGMQGHSTPTSPSGVAWSVLSQAWRHTSTKYPTPKGNMDHVSYFLPLYGLHSTVLGAYHKLGKPDSHGCVRLGRPEARALYRLIAMNQPRVKIYSLKNQKPSEEDLKEILPLLAMDLNFIQKELLARNNSGDVPFKTAKQYLEYKALQEINDLEQVQKINKLFNIKSIQEIYSEQDRLPDLKILIPNHAT
ncbi:MAG TPA: L,D-transpeptidase [Pseudobdellovibrionaceae bacterium]